MPNNFDYTHAIREVCVDISLRLPDFSHVRVPDIGFSFRQTRSNELFGIFASLTPLRFENGQTTGKRRGVLLTLPPVCDLSGHPLLYVLTIYMPRFANLGLSEKIETIVHELYHINESFNGDVRRFHGRCYAHGSSKTGYDQIVRKLAKEWLDRDPPPHLWAFLKYDFRQLKERYDGITGTRIRIPNLVRVSEPNPNETKNTVKYS